MKYIIALLICSVLTFADTNIQVSEKFDKQMEELYPLVELSLVQRQKSNSFFNSLEQEMQENGYLSSSSVHDIKRETKIQHKLRADLVKKVLMYEDWIDDDSIESPMRLKGVMLSLSSGIVLYDNYLLNISLFQKQKHLRKIINSKDKEYGLDSRGLLYATKEYSSVRNYWRMKKAIKYYRKNLQKDIQLDEQMIYLKTLIEKSPSYRAMSDKNFFQIVKQKLSFYGRASVDEVSSVKDDSVNLMSEVFGNGVGLVAVRKGKMHNKPEIEEKLLNTLKSGDILLEKTPFRLTDKLIPGYWGHAAVWVGTKQELIALGLWDNPVVVPYHKQIEDGKKIVEAVRAGVVLSSLGHFLNIDDMAILRENEIGIQKRKAIVLRAFAQLGKEYDFNFDVETTDKIVCSELVYTCYTHIKWPTSKALGRYTVSPDNIAQKTKTGELKLISLYYDGNEENKNEMLWQKMLKDEL